MVLRVMRSLLELRCEKRRGSLPYWGSSVKLIWDLAPPCEVIFWGQLKQGVNGGWNAWEGISRMHWSWLTVGEYSQRNWTLMRDFKQFITTVKWRNTCCQNCFCTQVYCQWSAKSISKSDIVLFWKNMAAQQLIKTLNKLYGSSITTEKLFGYFTLWSNKIFSFTDRKNQNQIKTTAYGL